MIALVYLMLIALFLVIYIYFLIKKQYFCDNLSCLINLNSNACIKYSYLKLPYSKLFNDLNYVLNLTHKQLYFEQFLYNEKLYLLSIAKYIDDKINSLKQTYRAKNDIIIIDNLSYILAKSIYQQNPYTIFKSYKKTYHCLDIKNKENKIFKFLLAQKLIQELIIIEKEIIHISKIIQFNKKRKFNIIYRKNIYNYAKYYSYFKYNSNSTFIEYKLKLNKSKIIHDFISELFNASFKIKIIITYLKTIF